MLKFFPPLGLCSSSLLLQVAVSPVFVIAFRHTVSSFSFCCCWTFGVFLCSCFVWFCFFPFMNNAEHPCILFCFTCVSGDWVAVSQDNVYVQLYQIQQTSYPSSGPISHCVSLHCSKFLPKFDIRSLLNFTHCCHSCGHCDLYCSFLIRTRLFRISLSGENQ